MEININIIIIHGNVDNLLFDSFSLNVNSLKVLIS